MPQEEDCGIIQFSIVQVSCNRNGIKLCKMKYKMWGLITTILLEVTSLKLRGLCAKRPGDRLSAAISIPVQRKEM